jgi:hypothetical protein
MQLRRLVVLAGVATAHGAFCPTMAPARPGATQLRATRILSLVTADDVEAAVQAAEKLWEEALAAREKADSLSAEGEALATEADAASSTATSSLNAIETNNKFSLSAIADASLAMNTNFNAGSLLAQAVDATEEAEQLEALAQAALDKSEELLAQHMEDFPDEDDNDDDEA